MSSYSILRTLGLTNHYSDDFGTFALEKRATLIGCCTSDECTAKKRKASGFNVSYIQVTKNKSDTHCPRCGHALFWRKTFDD